MPESSQNQPAPNTSPLTSRNEPQPKKKNRQWLWIIVLLIFALIFVLVLMHKDDSAAKKSTQSGGGGRHAGMFGPVTLTTATATRGDIGVYFSGIGTVTPVYTTTLYNQVAGIVTAVHYKEGQMVSKGQPLIDIDSRQYQANVDTATGNLQRDQNLLAQARMDLDRYRQAWANNAIPKQTLDDQEKVVLQDEGVVKADEGTLAYDKVQLSYCHIAAPITGRIGLRLVDPGNLVQSSSSTALAVITQITPTTVVFTLPEDDLDQILPEMKHGEKLAVELLDRSQASKIGIARLEALDNQIDTTTGSVKLRALYDNKDGSLFPNQFVNARLLARTEHDQTLVPTGAIQHNGHESFVYVIEDGKAKLVDVKEGITEGGLTAITGINPGDTVATSSFEKLQNGSQVHLATAQAKNKQHDNNQHVNEGSGQ